MTPITTTPQSLNRLRILCNHFNTHPTHPLTHHLTSNNSSDDATDIVQHDMARRHARDLSESNLDDIDYAAKNQLMTQISHDKRHQLASIISPATGKTSPRPFIESSPIIDSEAPVPTPERSFLASILNPYADKYRLQHWVGQNLLDEIKTLPEMPYMESKLLVDKLMRKFLKSDMVPSYADLLDDPEKVFGFHENIWAEGSLAVKFAVHYNLYSMMIQLLGNETHRKRFLSKLTDIGAFLMTELYTGTDVKSLGTTITYDTDKGSFVINTGDNKNQKYWIGNALVSARYGVLFGQLVTKGKNYGIHAFVVELRDAQGKLKPGIFIRDCGRKGGLNALDNGAIWFENVEIPRDNLLNKYADVSEDGTYHSDVKFNRRFALHIGALLFARIGVGSGGMSYSKVALAIALRFSHQRKQFINPKTGEGIRIIDYDLQQYRLIPLLAETFAASFFQHYVKRVYMQYIKEEGEEKKEELLKQTHLMASISKAQISWLGLRAIDESRECCGGQGYKFANRLVHLRSEADILVTLDGINHILLQSVSQILLGEYTKELQERNFISRSMYLAWEKASDFLAQGLTLSYYQTDSAHLCSDSFIINALDFRKERLKHTLAARLYTKIVKNKQAPFLAFNECAVHVVALGKAYSEFSTLKAFQKMLLRIKRLHKKDPDYKRIIRVLRDMFALHGLKCIQSDTFFLENSVISARKSKAIRREMLRLVKAITPHSLFLIEQFDMPEYIFDGTIGSKTESLEELNPRPEDDEPRADAKWSK